MKYVLATLFFFYAPGITNFNDDYHPVVLETVFSWSSDRLISMTNEYVCENMWQLFNNPDAKYPMYVSCHYWPYQYFDAIPKR